MKRYLPILPFFFALYAPLLGLYFRAMQSEEARRLWREVNGAPLWTLSLNSVQLAALTAFFAFLIGAPVGFALARSPRKWRAWGAILVALPLGIPPVLSAAPFFSLSYALRAPLFPTAFAIALCLFPVVALGTLTGFSSFSNDEENAALALVSPFQAFFGVLRGRIAPPIWASLGVVAALSLWEMGAPDLLSFPTLSSEVYRQLSSPDGTNQNFRAALSSWPLPILALFFLAPLVRFKIARAGGENARQNTFAPFGFVPLALILSWIFWQFARELESLSAIASTLGGDFDSIQNTLLCATISATICIFAALFLAFWWRDWPQTSRQIALAILLLPGLFAPVVLGVSLVEFFNREAFAALYDSARGMNIWGACARFFPLALLLCDFAVHNLESAPLEAAQNVGAPPFRAIWTVALPLLKNQIAGIWALLWAFCAGELTVTVLVHGAGGDTLPIRIFAFLHAGIASDVAAEALLLMALCGLAMGFAGWIFTERKWV